MYKRLKFYRRLPYLSLRKMKTCPTIHTPIINTERSLMASAMLLLPDVVIDVVIVT